MYASLGFSELPFEYGPFTLKQLGHCFMNLIQYNKHFLNTVDTGGLALWDQGSSSHGAANVVIRFQLLMG